MRSSLSTSLAAIASSALLTLAGCAGSLDHPERFAYINASPDAGGGGGDDSDAGCDPVKDIFPPNCTTGACHSASSQQGSLDLQSPGLPARLVDKRAKGGPGLLIDSAHPDQSVLLTKLTDTPPFQFQMPLGASPLSADEMACVTAWVQTAAAPPP